MVENQSLVENRTGHLSASRGLAGSDPLDL